MIKYILKIFFCNFKMQNEDSENLNDFPKDIQVSGKKKINKIKFCVLLYRHNSHLVVFAQ